MDLRNGAGCWRYPKMPFKLFDATAPTLLQRTGGVRGGGIFLMPDRRTRRRPSHRGTGAAFVHRGTYVTTLLTKRDVTGESGQPRGPCSGLLLKTFSRRPPLQHFWLERDWNLLRQTRQILLRKWQASLEYVSIQHTLPMGTKWPSHWKNSGFRTRSSISTCPLSNTKNHGSWTLIPMDAFRH